MKLKVKIKDTGLTIEKIKIASDSTVDTLISELIRQNLVNINFAQMLTVKGQEDIPLSRLRLQVLFAEEEKAEIYNADMKITLTHKKDEEQTLAAQKLLDYSKVVQTTGKLFEMTEEMHVRAGTLFYVQQQQQQYLLRYEDEGVEFFHFRNQYDEALQEMDRKPFLRVELKTRDALSDEELKWIRSIMFPSREKRNPLIHFDRNRISQELLDDIAMLIHRLIVVIGRFKRTGEALESSEQHVPTYVQVGEECSVGYIAKAQLDRIR